MAANDSYMQILKTVLKQIAELKKQSNNGPYLVRYPRSLEQTLSRDSNHFIAITLQQRIFNIPGVEAIQLIDEEKLSVISYPEMETDMDDTRIALYHSILADPYNDLPRLAYKDYLEENNHPSFEFLKWGMDNPEKDYLSDHVVRHRRPCWFEMKGKNPNTYCYMCRNFMDKYERFNGYKPGSITSSDELLPLFHTITGFNFRRGFIHSVELSRFENWDIIGSSLVRAFPLEKVLIYNRTSNTYVGVTAQSGTASYPFSEFDLATRPMRFEGYHFDVNFRIWVIDPAVSGSRKRIQITGRCNNQKPTLTPNPDVLNIISKILITAAKIKIINWSESFPNMAQYTKQPRTPCPPKEVTDSWIQDYVNQGYKFINREKSILPLSFMQEVIQSEGLTYAENTELGNMVLYPPTMDTTTILDDTMYNTVYRPRTSRSPVSNPEEDSL